MVRNGATLSRGQEPCNQRKHRQAFYGSQRRRLYDANKLA